MTSPSRDHDRILAATDFSPAGNAAVAQAQWAAIEFQAELVVAHVIADLRKAVSRTSYKSRIEFLEGQEEHFQRELRNRSDAKLKELIASMPRVGLDVRFETLLGEPYVELIHTVQSEKYDLVVCGARGGAKWLRSLLGSTARQLVRKCPSSVWVVKRPPQAPPKTILAATDLSDVSRRALHQAIELTRRAAATLHVLHVIEADSIPQELLDLNAAEGPYRALRELIADEGHRRFDDFLAEFHDCGVHIERHIRWGHGAEQIVEFAKELNADLIALGVVGRRGLPGFLLGNTAESVLMHSDCDILTVKPATFVSPIEPPTWELHPGPETPPSAG